MTEHVLSAPIAQSVESSSSVWGIFGWVRSSLASAFLSERERCLVSLIEPVCDTIGAIVLAAADRADLQDCLESAIERPDWYQLNITILRDPQWQALLDGNMAHSTRADWPVALLGGAAVAHLQRVERYLAEIATARRKLLALWPAAADSPPHPEAGEPLGFLTRPELHPDFKDALLDLARAEHCMIAILHAILKRRPIQPWLSLALAEKAAGGYYHYLRFLASIPPLEVPLAVVPAPDRFDLKRLRNEAIETEQWLHRFASGNGDCTYPFASDDP